MANWMDNVVFGTTKRKKKTLKKSRKTKGSFLGLGEGSSTALVVSNKPKAREIDAYIPPPRKRGHTIISSNRPQSEQKYEFSFKTNSDAGNPSVGSKEYQRQLKREAKLEKQRRDEEKREAQRQERIRKDLEFAEVHSASARKFESLARERLAKKRSRKQSAVGSAGRGLYNLINPYNKKIRVKRHRKVARSFYD